MLHVSKYFLFFFFLFTGPLRKSRRKNGVTQSLKSECLPRTANVKDSFFAAAVINQEEIVPGTFTKNEFYPQESLEKHKSVCKIHQIPDFQGSFNSV